MVNTCCVPACKSNYKKGDVYEPMFKIPESGPEREAWLKKIPRKDWDSSRTSFVCEKHFQPPDVLRVDEFPTEGGK